MSSCRSFGVAVVVVRVCVGVELRRAAGPNRSLPHEQNHNYFDDVVRVVLRNVLSYREYHSPPYLSCRGGSDAHREMQP